MADVGHDLPVRVPAQSQSNWCWAAVSLGVSDFYSQQGSTWTQCEVANKTLGRNDCCEEPVPDSCNCPWTLQDALSTVGNLGQISFVTPLKDVRSQIDSDLHSPCERSGKAAALTSWSSVDTARLRARSPSTIRSMERA